jgi:3-dehydroquinate dehydratase-2
LILMANFLIINGPNLEMLGTRAPEHYGSMTLKMLEETIMNKAKELGVNVSFCQSNIEGELVGFVNNNSKTSSGIIINPAGLTQVGYSLLDACIDSRLPIVEVHLSNIYGREEWRSHSIFSKVADSTVSGLKWLGYIAALEYLTSLNTMEV